MKKWDIGDFHTLEVKTPEGKLLDSVPVLPRAELLESAETGRVVKIGFLGSDGVNRAVPHSVVTKPDFELVAEGWSCRFSGVFFTGSISGDIPGPWVLSFLYIQGVEIREAR